MSWLLRACRSGALSLVLTLPPTGACGQARAAGADPPATLYRAGEYTRAIAAAEAALAADSNDARAAVVLLRALGEVGRYGEAERAGARLATRAALAPKVALWQGLTLKALGRVAEAGRAFQVAAGGADSLLARYEMATLAFEGGAVDDALRAYDRFIDVYNNAAGQLTGADLRAVARAVRRLGRRDPQLFKDALRAYDLSIQRDTMELDGRVELAEMFLEKFNGEDARKELAAVLAANPRHPRALLALARLEAFDGRGDPQAVVRRSLEVNPAAPEARAQAAFHLVDIEQYHEAIDEAHKGLQADSGAVAPWVAIAAARYLMGDRPGYDDAMRRVRARWPASADPDATLADVAARNRLYREATEFAAAGVVRDSLHPRSHALLGINEMRIGKVQEGSAHLQRAFALDPYDPWSKNTLDLLDTFGDYTELKTSRFVMLVEKKDAALMELFAIPLAEQAWDSLAARYAWTPTPPVRIEFFRSHADFSVRTVGLDGLGALGVSFGNVIAMDSPAARPVGAFNWGSTLWHELGHTFTLGASGNRIPRWVSEGLSVYEERRARQGWGSDVTPTLIAAYKASRLRPVSSLNNGFLRPRYAEEVPLSYALASYVCEMIEQQKGIVGIRQLIAAYRAGKTTEQAFREVLGVDGAALDQRFDTWFRQRFATEFGAVEPVTDSTGVRWEGPLYTAMRAATRAVAGEQWDEAVQQLERARGLFPGWSEPGSAYHLLAEVHEKRKDRARAVASLSAVASRNESAFEENIRLSQWLTAAGDTQGAVQALERTVYITPFDATVHDSLAAAASRVKAHATTVRSRRALVALNPSDRAEALYQLARALADAGDAAGARREVLRALDIAPNFEKAQELLLTLRRPEGSP